MCEHFTHVLPDGFVELFSWNIACATFLIPMRNNRLTPAQTHIIGIASWTTPTIAG
jgi:hypothetical protein